MNDDDRLVAYAAWIAGIAMRQGLHVEFVPDQPDRLHLIFGTDLTLELIVPEPPDWWHIQPSWTQLDNEGDNDT